MEDVYRGMKAICPRCKSWEHSKFRFLNNKRRSKRLQPRFICRRCDKYFTLGGKLYNTSLRPPSKARILSKWPCPGKVAVASPFCMSSCSNQYGDGYPFDRLHVETSSNSCNCMQRTVMAGACKTFERGHGEACCGMQHASRLQSHGRDFCGYSGRNICHHCLENPCSVINGGRCNGSMEMWWPHDDGSSQIYCTACHSEPDVIPLTFLQNFQDVMVGNQRIDNCPNTIPPFNNIGLSEPFEVSQQRNLEDGVLVSESVVEKAANGISVSGGQEEIADSSTNSLSQKNTVLHSELGNAFPAGSYKLEKENEWLMEFIAQGEGGKSSANGGESTISGSELEDNLDVCLGLEPYDFDWWEAPTHSGIANQVGENVGDFQGDFTVNDIANLWMF